MLNPTKILSWLSSTEKNNSSEALTYSDRRKFQRLNLNDCRVFIGDHGPFEVLNLGFGGLRFDISSFEQIGDLKIGQKLNCDIFLENIVINNRVIVKNLVGNSIGCAFSNLSTTESRVLKDFIKPRILGISIREIESSKLHNNNQELQMRWFQGTDGIQIFLWQTHDGQHVMQEFYFLNYFMSWENKSETFKTGIIKSPKFTGFGQISPDAIAFYKVPPYRALKLGHTILKYSDLPDIAKEKLINEISKEERRLFHRYLVKESGIKFCPVDFPALSLEVLNLSQSGIALLKNPRINVLKGNKLSGTLKLAKNQLQATIEIAYVENQCCGGNLGICKENIEKYSTFLAPRLLAQYLEKVPATIEIPRFAHPQARVFLYTGIHNSHILSLVSPEGELIAGRIAFIDKALNFYQNKLIEYECKERTILPCEWEIPKHLVNAESKPEKASVEFCTELIKISELEQEVKKAWLEVLECFLAPLQDT
ncbi:MAG: hypothetical protein Kow0029_21880 [Candidatus Rifleibacteriota bacterium]